MSAPVRHGKRTPFWPRFILYVLSVTVAAVVAIVLVVVWAPHPASAPTDEVDMQLPTLSVQS